MPIFCGYMVRFIGQNEHLNDMCYNEIGLCAQTIDVFQGSLQKQLERLM